MLRGEGRVLGGEPWAPEAQTKWTGDFYFVQVRICSSEICLKIEFIFVSRTGGGHAAGADVQLRVGRVGRDGLPGVPVGGRGGAW